MGIVDPWTRLPEWITFYFSPVRVPGTFLHLKSLMREWGELTYLEMDFLFRKCLSPWSYIVNNTT